jgi:hypothetical protein
LLRKKLGANRLRQLIPANEQTRRRTCRASRRRPSSPASRPRPSSTSSGLDWILDQYKEKTPRDPTIREKFNTYRFADYKEKVVDLIGRVTRVSVETMAITQAMRAASDLRTEKD